MTDAVFDFKSIARKLNRQEQKAEFEAKNPKEEPAAYLWPNGTAAVPYGGTITDPGHTHTMTTADLPTHMHVVTEADGSWSYLFPTTKI